MAAKISNERLQDPAKRYRYNRKMTQVVNESDRGPLAVLRIYREGCTLTTFVSTQCL